jgi:hypothetical protein
LHQMQGILGKLTQGFHEDFLKALFVGHFLLTNEVMDE